MPATPPAFVAGGTIRPSRFISVSTAADFTALEGESNAVVFGVSLEGSNYPPLSDIVSTNNAATVGQEVRIYGPGEVCSLEVGSGGVTRGDRLKSDGDGKAVTIASTGTTVQNYGAIALQSGAESECIRAYLVIGSVRPAIV